MSIGALLGNAIGGALVAMAIAWLRNRFVTPARP
jgi:hypothetical protein